MHPNFSYCPVYHLFLSIFVKDSIRSDWALPKLINPAICSLLLLLPSSMLNCDIVSFLHLVFIFMLSIPSYLIWWSWFSNVNQIGVENEHFGKHEYRRALFSLESWIAAVNLSCCSCFTAYPFCMLCLLFSPSDFPGILILVCPLRYLLMILKHHPSSGCWWHRIEKLLGRFHYCSSM